MEFADFPDWVKKHKSPGVQIHAYSTKSGMKFSLYEVKSKYNPEKKRAQKITGKYLGIITETGLLEKGASVIGRPKKVIQVEKGIKISSKSQEIGCKEYGASHFLMEQGKDIVETLQQSFPEDWKKILLLSINRLLYQSPLKNMQEYYENSALSQLYPEQSLNKNNLTHFIEALGKNRICVNEFFKKYTNSAKNLIFDLTDVISRSKSMDFAEVGYNSKASFDPQVNLFYIFSIDLQMPTFYRLTPGNISGMKGLELSIKESGTKNVIAVGDKGFTSKANLETLANASIKFVLPLRRDSKHIDYSRFKTRSSEETFDGHFFYRENPIFFYRLQNTRLFYVNEKPDIFDNQDVYIYENILFANGVEHKITNKKLLASLRTLTPDCGIIDVEILEQVKNFGEQADFQFIFMGNGIVAYVFHHKKLEYEEANDYLKRINSGYEGYSVEEFSKKEFKFGTLSLVTNDLNQDAKSVYYKYKSRGEIETMFNSFKNTLEADKTYMRSDDSINGCMFINHIALMLYYRILNLLKRKGKLSNTCPLYLLYSLGRVQKIRWWVRLYDTIF
jgi:transposase